MKTKLIPLLTAVCLAVTAAGCSSSGAQTAASAASPENAGEAASTAAASPENAGASASATAASPTADGTQTSAAENSAAAGADETVVYPISASGVTFTLPEELVNMEGSFQPAYGVELSAGSGIYLTALDYAAMPKDKYKELAGRSVDYTQEEIDYIGPRLLECILVYSIDGGRGLEDLTAALADYQLPAEGLKELGSAGEYGFYYLPNPHADELESVFIFDQGFREEYDRLIEICEMAPSWISISEPESAKTAAEGDVITFETTDLDGNPVSSADIFSAHKITMVNLWGTYCGPCIGEMPDLEVLNARLKEKDCAIIGVVIDVRNADDAAMISTAREIIADTGVTYLNLVPWSTIRQDLPSEFIPTTYFIDSNGAVVGEAAIGARGADEYEALLDALL